MVLKSENRFIKLNLITIVVTLLVILAGGVVRSTGSGMGCPDWPKCFGQYVPPTHVSQLPADYKEKYVDERVAKNERFAKTLEKMGKGHLADSIRHDESILQPETFNVAKTWTEYANRLMGVLTGFFLLGLAAYSFTYRRKATRVTILSVSNVIIVGFQGWLGSIVVSTNLMPWIVTVHMLLALVILGILIYTYNYVRQLNEKPTVVIEKLGWLKVLLFGSIVLSVIQIEIGTEVREAIDAISKQMMYSGRNTWVSKVGDMFLYHRDLAILVLVINVIVYKVVRDKFNGKTEALRIGYLIWIVLIIQISTGLILSNFSLPPYAQGIHMLFSTVLFSLQYYLYLLVYRSSTYNQQN